MKYYLLNKEECRQNIWNNPELVKTKSFAKIEKYKSLVKKIEKLKADITKELRSTNTRMIKDEWIDLILTQDLDEITVQEYNAMYPLCLFDRQEQRMGCYNKTKIMKGKLYGDEITLDTP